jgi:hypothetical protein
VHVDAIYYRTIIKEPKSQIFVDVAQEGVNHGNTCVMCYVIVYCISLLSVSS